MRKKILGMLHAQAHKTVRMELTREGRPNELRAVDAAIALMFAFVHLGRGTTDAEG